VPLHFHFRVKVMASEDEAYDYLMHFQNCFPADARAFFKTQTQTQLATQVCDELHRRYGGAFKDRIAMRSRMGAGQTADPQRPFLNDYVLFWLLKESELLVARDATKERVLSRLEEMNDVLRAASRLDLGESATEHMRTNAASVCGGCFLGFFRENKLHWATLAGRLPALVVSNVAKRPAAPAASSGSSAAVGKKRARPDSVNGEPSGANSSAAAEEGDMERQEMDKLHRKIRFAEEQGDEVLARLLRQKFADL